MKNITKLAAIAAITSLNFAYAKDEDVVVEKDRNADAIDNVTDTTSEKKMVNYGGFIEADGLVGNAVYNMQDEKIGDIEQILIDSKTGGIRFVVISVGGFLGIGDHHTAVPWSRLQFKTEVKVDEDPADDNVVDKERYLTVPEIYINTTKEQLTNSPAFDAEKTADLYNDEHSRGVMDYWKAEGGEVQEKSETRKQ